MKYMFLLLGLLAFPVLASDSERLREAAFSPSREAVSVNLQLKNQTVLEYLWLDIYAAAFYSTPDTTPRQAISQQTDQRLELYYFQSISREDVIEAAWTTLQRQNNEETLRAITPELERLHSSFRDITPGDRYALIFSQQRGIQLQINDREVFSSPDRQLAQAYLGIWLAPNGLSDQLRQALLAER